eukprot:177478_1
MMQSCLLVLLSLYDFGLSDFPPRWGKWGEYPCQNKSVRIGGYVAGGSQNAVLLYPKSAIANGTILPFVAFAHGMSAGGDRTYPAYMNVLQEVCSYGYIIGAPQSCQVEYCEKFYEDVITTVVTMSTKGADIDPALQFADFSKIAVYGHSMGGAATVHVSDSDNINLTCSAPMHPGLAQETNQSESLDIIVPSLWFCGEEDVLVTPSEVYNGFKQDMITPKIFADITDATHTSDMDNEAPYIGQWFDCNIRNDQNACDYFFKTGPNNICTGGFGMTHCYICTNETNDPNCYD